MQFSTQGQSFFLGVLHYRQRTSVEEYMIPQRVSHKAMRQMILASDKADRQAALDKLLAMQREDITELFQQLVFLSSKFWCGILSFHISQTSFTTLLLQSKLSRIMDGLPVTVRLLDPPLHECSPQSGPAQ